MNLKKHLISSLYLSFSFFGYSQFNDSLPGAVNKVDSEHACQYSGITISNYFKLLKEDFIHQASASVQMHGGDLLKVTGFALITAGVMNYDESVNHTVLKLDAKSSAIRAISPVVTKFGGRYEVYTIGAIGAWSYLFKDQKLKTATLLATQAYITSGVWVSVIKFMTGRSRPTYFDVHTQEDESYWHGPFYQFRKNSSGHKPDGSEYSSFPSGHTAAAFSVATVYAEVYKDKPWVAAMAYSSATLIGLSRITENKHWASDVLVGSALGYLCGKQVIRNYHRLERLNSLTRKKRNVLNFNINYINRSVTPELIYTFR